VGRYPQAVASDLNMPLDIPGSTDEIEQLHNSYSKKHLQPQALVGSNFHRMIESGDDACADVGFQFN